MRREPIEVRLARFTVRSDGCWEWAGARNGRGYGTIRLSRPRRQWLVHRVVWEITYGPIPVGVLVCHHCDNPPCVRPDHLFLGTKVDNAMDMARKGRSGTAKLTPEIVLEMRALRLQGTFYRDLAARYGIHRMTAWRAVTGARWSHV